MNKLFIIYFYSNVYIHIYSLFWYLITIILILVIFLEFVYKCWIIIWMDKTYNRIYKNISTWKQNYKILHIKNTTEELIKQWIK